MEEHLSERTEASEAQLRYLGGEKAEPPLREATAAEKIAREHEWLIERGMERLAARWPDEIEVATLREQAGNVLNEVAQHAEDRDEIGARGAVQIERRLCEVLACSEWYRQAMIGRARPLCDTWTGALLAGREPTDHLLRSRMQVDDGTLNDRFMEMAVLFAVEPAALLPQEGDLHAVVETALTNLPPEQQLATAIYFQEQTTLAELGGVMGISPEEAQELLGRSACALVGEAAVSTWPGHRLTA